MKVVFKSHFLNFLLFIMTAISCNISNEESYNLKTGFPEKHTKDEVIEDLSFLFRTLEEVHPDLYAYTPETFILEEKDRIEKSIQSPLTRIEFYSKIAPLIATLNDGHTFIEMPFDEVKEYMNRGGKLFPFDLDFKENKAIIAANYSPDSSITKGSELTSINNISMKEIYEHFFCFISSERIPHKTEMIEVNFTWLLWLLYGFEGPFKLGIVHYPSTDHIFKNSDGVTYETIREQKHRKSGKRKYPYYHYKSFPEDKIGIITIYFFVDMKPFKKFLEDTFFQIQHDRIEHLIIDIRRNAGGNTNLSNELIRYLTDKPFQVFSKYDVKVSSQVKNQIKTRIPKIFRWLPFYHFHPHYKKIWNAPEGKIVTIKDDFINPRKNRVLFKGGIYVLTGPFTYSTAIDFAAIIQDFNIGTIIGEETGGPVNTFGDTYRFKLPNTQIGVRASYKYFIRPSGEINNRDLIPDFIVKDTIEDIYFDTDSVMDFTLKFIESN